MKQSMWRAMGLLLVIAGFLLCFINLAPFHSYYECSHQDSHQAVKESDQNKVKVLPTAGAFKANGIDVPVYRVEGIRAELSLSPRENAPSLRVSCSRSKDSCSILFFRTKGIVIDTKDLRVESKQNISGIRYTTPSTEQSLDQKDDYSVRTVFHNDTSKLVLERAGFSREFTWTTNERVYPTWFVKNYRFGFATVRNRETGVYSKILVIDKKYDKIVGSLDLPLENDTPYVEMVVDVNSDILLVFDHQLGWILIADIRNLHNGGDGIGGNGASSLDKF